MRHRIKTEIKWLNMRIFVQIALEKVQNHYWLCIISLVSSAFIHWQWQCTYSNHSDRSPTCFLLLCTQNLSIWFINYTILANMILCLQISFSFYFLGSSGFFWYSCQNLCILTKTKNFAYIRYLWISQNTKYLTII